MHEVAAVSKLPTWHPSHARHPWLGQQHALGPPPLQGLLPHAALLAVHQCSSHRVLMKALLPWQSCKEAAPLTPWVEAGTLDEASKQTHCRHKP